MSYSKLLQQKNRKKETLKKLRSLKGSMIEINILGRTTIVSKNSLDNLVYQSIAEDIKTLNKLKKQLT